MLVYFLGGKCILKSGGVYSLFVCWFIEVGEDYTIVIYYLINKNINLKDGVFFSFSPWLPHIHAFF